MMSYDFSKTPAPYDFSKNSVVKAWDEFAKKISQAGCPPMEYGPMRVWFDQPTTCVKTWVDNVSKSNPPKE